MTWLEAFPLEVLSMRENGSGRIRIPLAVPSQNDTITLADLQQIVANFERFPVVPIGVSPHRDFAERAGFSPGFVESVELQGETLFGVLDLIAPLFHEVVELGGWRGFSVEMAKDLKTTTKEIDGWVLTGGVLTNRPAVDAHFTIAAEARSDAGMAGSFSVPITAPRGGRGETMSDKQATPGDGATADRIRTLEADNSTLESRIETLNAEVREAHKETETVTQKLEAAQTAQAEADAKIKRLEADARRTASLAATSAETIAELEKDLEAERTVNLDAKVQELIDAAVKSKVPPRIFKGHESGPAAWMQSNFKDIKAFEDFISRLPGAGMEATGDDEPVKSGHVPGKDPAAERDAGEFTVSAEVEAELEKRGLGGLAAFDNVVDEESAMRVAKQLEAAKAAASKE